MTSCNCVSVFRMIYSLTAKIFVISWLSVSLITDLADFKYLILIGLNLLTLSFLLSRFRRKKFSINITTPKNGIIEIKFGKSTETLAFLVVNKMPMVEQEHLKKNIDSGNKDEIFPQSHIHTFYNLKTPLLYEIQTDGSFATLILGTKSSKPAFDDEIKVNVDILETAIQTAYPGVELKQATQSELVNTLAHPFTTIPDSLSISDSVGIAYFEGGKRKEFFSVVSVVVKDLELNKLNRTYTDDIINFIVTQKIRATFSVVSSPRKTLFMRTRKSFKESKRSKYTKGQTNSKKTKGKNNISIAKSYSDSALWNYQINIILVDKNETQLKRNTKRIITALSTIFMHGKSDVSINLLTKNKLKRAVLMHFCRRFTRKGKITGGLLSLLVALPRKTYPGIEMNPKPTFLPFSSKRQEHLRTPAVTQGAQEGKLYLGNSIWAKNSSYPIFVNLSSLMLHTAIIGESGFGKTEYVKFLVRQINRTAQSVKWLIFDFKGEYVKEFAYEPDVKIVPFGSKERIFSINLLDTGGDELASHVNKLFFILYNAMTDLFNSSAELTPQMERLLKESLLNAVKLYKEKNISGRPIDILFEEIEKYVVANRTKNPTLVFTAEALKNRLSRLREGPLAQIFNTSNNFLDVAELMSHNTVIDLSPLVTQGALLLDLQLVVSILAKYIFDYVLKRGLVKNLKHVTVFEEANLILSSPKSGRINVLEEMALMIRSMGEGLVFVSQRPTISYNILANTATKIFFRTTIDSDVVSKMLNLTEEQLEYVKVLPIGEAIVTPPNFAKPVRLKINLSKEKNQKVKETSKRRLGDSRKLQVLRLISEGWDTLELLQRKTNISSIELKLLLMDLFDSDPPLLEKEGMFFRVTKAGMDFMASEEQLQIVK